MKIYTNHIEIETKNRIDFINITSIIENELEKSGISDGLILINPMHITSSIFINDNEQGLIKDFKIWLEKIAPMHLDNLKEYNHNLTGEDNAYAHLWRTIMGRETTIAITNKKIDFGPWESIFYGEFDGKRRKKILVKIMGE